MESKLQLNQGDVLKQTSHRSKGTQAETDIYTYSIINKAGEEVGTVEYIDHTAIKGFRRTQTVVQKDIKGKVLIEKSW